MSIFTTLAEKIFPKEGRVSCRLQREDEAEAGLEDSEGSVEQQYLDANGGLDGAVGDGDVFFPSPQQLFAFCSGNSMGNARYGAPSYPQHTQQQDGVGRKPSGGLSTAAHTPREHEQQEQHPVDGAHAACSKEEQKQQQKEREHEVQEHMEHQLYEEERRQREEERRESRLSYTEAHALDVTSSINKPNMRKLLKAISMILLDQIEEDEQLAETVRMSPDWAVFDESVYLWERRGMLKGVLLEKFTRKPNAGDIEKFMLALYECAEYSPECNVLCLLYINRLIAFTGLPLHYANWRPLVFTALIVAQKAWDDRYLGNGEFAYIYPFFTLNEINKMEAAFLKLLQYQVLVKPSTYAKYYFELRSFFKNAPEEMPMPPLNNLTAERLEKQSEHFQSQITSRFKSKNGETDRLAMTVH